MSGRERVPVSAGDAAGEVSKHSHFFVAGERSLLGEPLRQFHPERVSSYVTTFSFRPISKTFHFSNCTTIFLALPGLLTDSGL